MKRNLFNFKKFLTTKHKLNEIKNQLLENKTILIKLK